MILQIAYLGLTLAMIFIIGSFGFSAIDKTFEPKKRGTKKQLLVIGLFAHQLYIFLVASTGFIQDFSFPPRFALTMIIPAFLFTGIFVYKNRNAEWLVNIAPSKLFFFQSFRILVELIFIFSVAEGFLHKEASIEGYNFDMLYAITVLVVGYFAFVKKSFSLKLVLVWNYVGLGVLASVIFVFMTSIYQPELYGATEPLLPMSGLTYPYVLVAGFLMPIAVFVHVLSIAQLKRLID